MDAIDTACDALERMRRPELAASLRVVRYVADNPDAVLWDLVFEATKILEAAGLPGVAEIAGLLERRSLLLPIKAPSHCPFCGNFELGAIQDRTKSLPWSILCLSCGASGPHGDSGTDAREAWAERNRVE